MKSQIKINAIPLILFLTTIVSLIYVRNMGGSGLEIPGNILICMVMSISIIFSIISILIKRIVIIPQRTGHLIFGLSLLTIPILWTENPQQVFGRIACIWGGAGVLFCLMQFVDTEKPRKEQIRILSIILIIIYLQAVLSVIQIFAPKFSMWFMEFSYIKANGRPYGIFQQSNLLGSFLSSGIGISLLISYLNNKDKLEIECHCNETHIKIMAEPFSFREIIRLMGLVLLWCVLVWTQSRTGLIGAFFVSLLFFIVGGIKKNKFKKELASTLIGVFSGLLIHHSQIWPSSGVVDLLHTESTKIRIALLIGTWEMITQHPILGWGLGSFETTWPLMFHQTGLPMVTKTTFMHPHNEILYEWSEGGIPGLIGLLLVMLYTTAPNLSKRKKGGIPKEISLTSLVFMPFLLHVMTEFPFYQSLLHYFIFILLIVVLWIEFPCKIITIRDTKLYITALGVLFPLGLIFGAITMIMSWTLSFQMTLTDWERGGLLKNTSENIYSGYPKPVVFLGSERFYYDLNTRRLLEYNINRNKYLLDQYKAWANKFLSRRNDSNVSYALMRIYSSSGDYIQSEKVREKAILSYPDDSRFYLN